VNILQLIAGSGNTEEVSDGHETTGGSSGLGYSAVGAQVASEVPQLGHSDKDDGYTSGIPGPITRLFIIANRGVSNLIQDLILVHKYIPTHFNFYFRACLYFFISQKYLKVLYLKF
jgi:hypothetical protein